MGNTLKENLRRIKELTETVVPYSETIKEKIYLYDADGKQGGELVYVHKTVSFAVVEGHVKEGFVHQKHYHEETEILTLLSGKAFVDIIGKITLDLAINVPIVIQPKTYHSVHYLADSIVLAMTIPASPDFPNKEDATYE